MPIRRRELLLGSAGFALLGGMGTATANADEGRYPAAASDIFLPAPIDRWDEGLPLGTGLLGAVIWGAGKEIRLSLDRSDLWDRRQPPEASGDAFTYANLEKLKDAGDSRGIEATFVKPYEDNAFPCKIPAGRLVIALRDNQYARAFHLDLSRAEARVNVGTGQLLSVIASDSDDNDVILMRISGALPEMKFVRPKVLNDLGGYPDAVIGNEERAFWMIQKGPEGSGVDYAMVADSRRVGEETLIALTVLDDSNKLPAGRLVLKKTLDRGYDEILNSHVAKWRKYWSGGHLTLPDDLLQAQCDRTRYFFGASKRADAPPIGLQGVWTEESGTAVPRRGEYRHDFSLPFSYLPCTVEGLAENGSGLLNHYLAKLPTYMETAQKIYGVSSGAIIPAETTLDGKQVGGWPAESLSPTPGAWVALLFLRQQRFQPATGTASHDHAYKFASEIGTGLLGLLKADDQGHLKLPLSSSPEAGGSSMLAFLKPNSNWDLTLLHTLFGELAEAAKASGKSDEAARWHDTVSKLEPLHKNPATNELLIAEKMPYDQSTRHLGHAAAIYPFGMIGIEGSIEDRKCVLATLETLRKNGTDFWEGYTYAWYSALLARSGEAERALVAQNYFARGFLSRNGFHIGGDQSTSELSRLKTRTFSLEGNLMGLSAIHEMLLQTWGGAIRIFPATTVNWLDVSFRDLHAEGGVRVSATRKNGRLVFVGLEATHNGTYRLRNPFGSGTPHWSQAGVRREGADYLVTLQAGETVEARA